MLENIETIKNEVYSIATAYLTDFKILKISFMFEDNSDNIWEAHLESVDGSRFVMEYDTEEKIFFEKVTF